MRNKQLLDEEDNQAAYKKALKKYREDKALIHCGYCRYHKKENVNKRPGRSWKKNRKRRYRAVNNI